MQRRVYDALNVLCALDVIIKDRNKVTFKGYQGLVRSPLVNFSKNDLKNQGEMPKSPHLSPRQK